MQPPFWKRLPTISPAAATLLGLALGCALAVLCAFHPPRDFSYGFLGVLLLSIGPCGGILGYTSWLLLDDAARSDRFQRLHARVSVLMILVLLAGFPSFWWQLGQLAGPFFVVISMGFVCGVALFAAGAGCGIVHLVHHLVRSSRRASKPVGRLRTDGVWDRELDQGPISSG